MSVQTTQLERRLGTRDAVGVGLASMVGAGIFAVFGPAAAAAGAGLLVAVLVAGAVAYCNATASAQLAAAMPRSGGTYTYGRERLGHWWGFLAGWGFVVGKTASCAAMALTCATYAVPDHRWAQRLLAAAAVAALTGLNCLGVAKTSRVSLALVVLALVGLAVVVSGVWAGGVGHADSLQPSGWTNTTWHGVLQAAGLTFFAFAGYARIATLGEEVREPARTIPTAIVTALAIVLVVYLIVAVSVLAALGPAGLARSASPLADAVRAVGSGWLAPVVRAAAVVASLGSLMALVAGVGRTSLAMAREHDLPYPLSVVHPRFKTPARAELLVGAVVCALVMTSDLRHAIGFSSFGVLVYYAVANAAAYTQPESERRWPRGLHVLGLVGCVGLAASLPWSSVVVGLLVFAVGLLGRLLLRSGRPSR